jgi:DNA ligase (NAD+)
MNKSEEQLELTGLNSSAAKLSQETIDRIVRQDIAVDDLSEEQLVSFLETANERYRSGQPIISDAEYDFTYLAELRSRNASHPFLNKVEPEPALGGKTVRLPTQMLSTDKAYSKSDIDKWLNRIIKAAEEVNVPINEIAIRVTPKLDGYAAYDDGERLYTRGDGRSGTDISRVFERGLQVGGDRLRGQGAGEIVVSRDYFNQYLAGHFENSRNFQASLIKEKELDPLTEKAIRDGKAVFYPFAQLPDRKVPLRDLKTNFEMITEEVWGYVDFDVDGVVLETTDERIKFHMGATRHHHRWQIAFKRNTEKAQVRVLSVKPQTARTGRVTPVVQLDPTRLSGATLSRATAHHYGMVRDRGIGAGALIELVRSGLVIPKIENVIEPAEPEIPKNCPTCNAELVWDADYLVCPNIRCSAQIENKLEHFFKTLKNVDGFGPQAVKTLHKQQIDSISKIYSMSEIDFRECGFGDKTSTNMVNQLSRSRTETIEDWRFLAAFGVFRMGTGNCERLLQHVRLEDIFALSVNDIIAIDGFAETTATIMVAGFAQIQDEFTTIYASGFNLERTPIVEKDAETKGALSGKTIVFTGSMLSGKRADMQKEAKKRGAKVGTSITGKTDLLITGENVGANKINAAQDKGVKVLTEHEYLSLLEQEQ